MAKKSKKNRVGVVFSTNPEYDYSFDEDMEVEDIAENQQKLRVLIDRKKRKGKEVTLVTGFVGTEDNMKALGKVLKSKCGVGGAVKDGEIMIQGNQRDKIVKILLDLGYTGTKKSGN